jgi:hypothetical protein
LDAAAVLAAEPTCQFDRIFGTECAMTAATSGERLQRCRQVHGIVAKVVEMSRNEGVLAAQVLGHVAALGVRAAGEFVPAPALFVIGIVADVAAGIACGHRRLLLPKARVREILLQREHVIDPHGVDQLAVRGFPGRADADDPVSLLGRSADLGLADRQRAISPEWIGGGAVIRGKNVTEKLHIFHSPTISGALQVATGWRQRKWSCNWYIFLQYGINNWSST